MRWIPKVLGVIQRLLVGADAVITSIITMLLNIGQSTKELVFTHASKISVGPHGSLA